jgi:sulfatase modifying factor 1
MTDSRSAGESFQDFPGGPEMIVIPPGEFLMGSPVSEALANGLTEAETANERPQRMIRFEHPFAFGKFEVTRAQYAAFVEDSGYKGGDSCRGLHDATMSHEETERVSGPVHHVPIAGRSWRDPGFPQGDDEPVVCVSWTDAQEYVAWLSSKSGRRYRLPSEAEWEYVARAGTSTARFWGDDPNSACGYGNFRDVTLAEFYGIPEQAPEMFENTFFHCTDGHVWTAPVGSGRPNPFGVYDILGNAAEWVEDCYTSSYSDGPTDGSAYRIETCDRRIVRGGTWGSIPRDVRSAARALFIGDGTPRAYGLPADDRDDHWGIRVACDLS